MAGRRAVRRLPARPGHPARRPRRRRRPRPRPRAPPRPGPLGPGRTPDRFLLLDLDTPADAAPLVPHALTAAAESGEPVLAVRDGVLKAPRLARATTGTRALVPPASAPDWRLDTDGGTLEHLRLVAAPEAAAPWPPAPSASRCGPPGSTSATPSSPSACTPTRPPSAARARASSPGPGRA
ncbi:hypothetical protein ACFQVA_40965 [Actinomadura keratinilytica]